MTPEMRADRVAQLRTRLVPFIESMAALLRAPGFAVGVVSGRELVFEAAFGVTRVTGGAPITPETLFHMASVTKPFVATAIMQLVEAGRIDLDAPVTTYLPYFTLADPSTGSGQAQRVGALTVRQMLSHTSGMPDTDDYEWDKPQHDEGALERYVRSISNLSLIGAPGERFAYSNIAYEVLGDVIAKAGSESFESFVGRHILAPLDMTNSVLAVADAEQSLVARGHTIGADGEVIERAVYPYNRAHAPSSTLVSNVRDMSRWAAALLNQGELEGARILRAETLEQMWTPQVRVHPEMNAQVGLSWFLNAFRGRRTVQHSGGDIGFNSEFVLVPDERLAVVAMGNDDFAYLHDTIAKAALEVLLGP